MELTNHAKQRYAERIVGKESAIDINTYIAQNPEKIESGLSKLIEHSEIIFQGICSSGKDPVTVRLSGTWVIILDQADRVVITLYKIDLGVDEELNKLYVQKHLERLNVDLVALAEKKEQSTEEISAYRQAIKENESLVEEYEGLIKRLKNDNKYYEEIIKGKSAEWSGLEMAVRRDVDALTKRIEF